MKNPLRSYLYGLAVISCFFIWFVPGLSGQSSVEHDIRTDEILIVPGVGSQSVMLGEAIDSIIKRSGREKFKISKPVTPGELFKDIFHVNVKNKIVFDAIYYSEKSNVALCISRGNVAAIIGFINTGITVDGVSLASGINNFIFHYGNNEVTKIRQGSHELYIYQMKGIAVIDDDMNDIIDLYIVFPQGAK